MDGQKHALELAYTALAAGWAGGRGTAERWALYDLLQDGLIARWPADAARISAMMVLWVMEIRGNCVAPAAAANYPAALPRHAPAVETRAEHEVAPC